MKIKKLIPNRPVSFEVKFDYVSLVILLGIVYIGFFILRFSRYPIDDGFIHLRIARNILSHGQPYFNLDEAVMGSAPHLWVNLLACLLWLFDGSLNFLPYLAFALTVGCYLCCIRLLRFRYSKLQASICALIPIAAFLMPSAAGLMETPFGILLFLVSLIMYSEGRWSWAGAVGACAMAVRPEFSLYVIFSLIFTPNRHARLRFIAGTVPLIGGYLIYVFYYFGTVIPFPAFAKRKVFPVPIVQNILATPPSAIANNWVYRTLAHLPFGMERFQIQVILLALLIFFGFLFWRVRNDSVPGWVRVILASSATLYIVNVLNASLIFSWYWPIFMLPLGLTFLILTSRRLFVFQLAAFLVAFPVLSEVIMIDHYSFFSFRDEFYEEFTPGWRVEGFLEIGKELNQLAPGKILLTPEIGALGWSYSGKIVDFGALVTPAALKYYKPGFVLGDARIETATLDEFVPDFVVALDEWFVLLPKQLALKTKPDYRLWKTLPIVPEELCRQTGVCQLWRSREIQIYARQ